MKCPWKMEVLQTYEKPLRQKITPPVAILAPGSATVAPPHSICSLRDHGDPRSASIERDVTSVCVGGREDLRVRGAPQKVLRTPLTSQTTIAASRPYTAIWSQAGSGLLAWLLAGGGENDVFVPLSCIPLSSRRRSFISVVPGIISCTAVLVVLQL